MNPNFMNSMAVHELLNAVHEPLRAVHELDNWNSLKLVLKKLKR